MDKNDINHITRHVARMLRYAKYADHLGKISIGLGVAKTVDATYNECAQTNDGWVCGRAVVGNSAGLGFGMAASYLAGNAIKDQFLDKGGMEALSRGVLGREIACNLSLDIETGGAGAILCQIVVVFGTSSLAGTGASWSANRGARILYNKTFNLSGS